MTISARAWPRRAALLAAGAVAIMGAWFGSVVAITAFGDGGEAVMVWIEPEDTASALRAADAVVLEVAGGFLHIRSSRPGFVRDLYAAGAHLVLPAPLRGGCMASALL